MSDTVLKPDGERFLPQFSGTIALEHYHRYFLAQKIVEGLDVLDIASGEGFGSEILARVAKSVVGVDIAEEATAYAAQHYMRDNLRFVTGSATEIPLTDGSVDVIISFETIEHLENHDGMMAEIRRVLRPNGCLMMSSPNKLVYTDRPDYHNPFHVRELYTKEFIDLVQRYFGQTAHYAQRVTAASVVARQDSDARFATYTTEAACAGVADQMYDIILASDATLPDITLSLRRP